MNKEDFKTHRFFNCLSTELLQPTGAYRSFADTCIFIYVTNNKFLCINLHNYIYYFFYFFTFNSFKNSSAHTMQNSCKIALFATVSTSISRRSPTSFFRTTPLQDTFFSASASSPVHSSVILVCLRTFFSSCISNVFE